MFQGPGVGPAPVPRAHASDGGVSPVYVPHDLRVVVPR